MSNFPTQEYIELFMDVLANRLVKTMKESWFQDKIGKNFKRDEYFIQRHTTSLPINRTVLTRRCTTSLTDPTMFGSKMWDITYNYEAEWVDKLRGHIMIHLEDPGYLPAIMEMFIKNNFKFVHDSDLYKCEYTGTLNISTDEITNSEILSQLL